MDVRTKTTVTTETEVSISLTAEDIEEILRRHCKLPDATVEFSVGQCLNGATVTKASRVIEETPQ